MGGRWIREVRIHLLQFGAWCFGMEIMITERTIRPPRREDRQAERDRCIEAMLIAIEEHDREAYRAQARVLLALPWPERDDFAHGDSLQAVMRYSFCSQEFEAFRSIARSILEQQG